jgi:opacity protein-like surface antigen
MMVGLKRRLNRGLLSSGIALALGMAAPSEAAELWGGVPYVGLGGGLNFESDPAVKITQDLGIVLGPYPLVTTKQSGLGIGALGLITGGLDFQNGWRAELEASYRHHSNARFNVQAEGSTTVGVDRTTYALMANVWHDFSLADGLDLHIGGGLGVSELEMNVTNTFSASRSIDQTEGAYQAGLGFDYALIPGLKATLDYRIFGFFNRDSGNLTGVPTTCFANPASGICFGHSTERLTLAAQSALIDQSLIFGTRWSFGP